MWIQVSDYATNQELGRLFESPSALPDNDIVTTYQLKKSCQWLRLLFAFQTECLRLRERC